MLRGTNERYALAADSSAEDSLVFNGEEVVFFVGHFLSYFLMLYVVTLSKV